MSYSSFNDILSVFSLLPGLRGFWPMSSVAADGSVVDLSGHGESLDYNGAPVYNIYSDVPFIELDGTADQLSHADDALYDITGTESYIDPLIQGLTLGGWFWVNAFGVAQTPMAKDSVTGTERSYKLRISAAGIPEFFVWQTSAISVSVSTPGAITTGTWNFITGRFMPNDVISILVNGQKSTVATTITDIYNSSTIFRVGADQLGRYLGGRASLCFICAAALPDNLIDRLFQTSRSSFGV